MSVRSKLLASLSCAIPSVLFGAVSLAPTSASADCSFTPPLTTQTKCVKAVAISGQPLRSFDISWVDPKRAEYYLGDRSNAGIDVIDTASLTFKRTIGGFVGIKLNAAGAVDNNHSGPDGVVSHDRWLYAGDGDSTLKVIDLDAPTASAIKASIPTGGTTRVDEMALTSNGKLLLAANNAEDPPFATLFTANGNAAENSVSIIARITVASTIIPAGFGLSLEQPAWDPTTKRFYTAIPIIANNPSGCNYGQLPDISPGVPAPITCNGGVLVTDPKTVKGPTTQEGAFDPATNTGVIALKNTCGPNGASVGPDDNIIFGCNPANNPANVITLVMNAMTHNEIPVVHITGADEVWFNSGDDRYYTGSSRDCAVPGTPCPTANLQKAVLGVIDAQTNALIEKVPQSSGSHSVAADSKRNLIFVPQVAPVATVSSGGDTTTVGAGICGTANGCVAVYQHNVKSKDNNDNQGNDDAQD